MAEKQSWVCPECGAKRFVTAEYVEDNGPPRCVTKSCRKKKIEMELDLRADIVDDILDADEETEVDPDVDALLASGDDDR